MQTFGWVVYWEGQKEIINLGPFGNHCASPLKLDRELKQQMKSDRVHGDGRSLWSSHRSRL